MTQAFDALIEKSGAADRVETRGLRTEVISSQDAFEALRPELDTLCGDLCEENIFYEPWMIVPALAHLGSGKLDFLCFYDDGQPGRLCGFLPLMRAQPHPLLPFHSYQSWHHPQCFRCTPLFRRGFALSCWNALFDWLERQPLWRRFVFLRRLPADGEVERALRRVLEQRPALRHAALGHETAFLHIGADSDTVLRQAMSGTTLGKLRRQQRRLAEDGDLAFAEVDQESDLDRLLDQFLELEASGWKGRMGTALACKANEEAFFRSVISQARQRGQLSFLTMRLNGKLLAAQSSLVGRSGSFLFKTAYDESYSKYSPGIVLEIEHLRRMHDPADPLRGKLAWSDSCAGPGDGPVYRCWPERRTIRECRIACGLGPATLIVLLWPLLRRLHQALQRRKAGASPAEGAQPSAKT